MMLRAMVKGMFTMPFLLFLSTCYAGGDSWAFIVTEFSSDKRDKYVVKLIPVAQHGRFPTSCASLTVAGEYASLFWFLKFGGGPSAAQHKLALSLLSDAFSSKKPIAFGWIGEGINLSKGSGACAATSRGLAVEQAVNGESVFSYYKWP